MSAETMPQPCQKLIQTFLVQIAPKMEDLKGEFSWPALFELFDDAVDAVENMKEIQGGQQKKECAIELIMAVYDRYQLDIPYLPNMFEKKILRTILNVVIDGIVAILNKRGVFEHGTQ